MTLNVITLRPYDFKHINRTLDLDLQNETKNGHIKPRKQKNFLTKIYNFM